MIPCRVLYADPPWAPRDKLPGKARGAARNYPVLSLDEIKTFPLPPLAEDAWLFLWRIACMRREAVQMIRAWGFEPPQREIVWVKTSIIPVRERIRAELPCHEHRARGRDAVEFLRTCNDCADRVVGAARRLHIGMGHVTRGTHELLLVAKRGRPAVYDRGVPSVLFAPYRGHSVKPVEAYTVIDRLVGPGPGRVELFARTAQPGWDAYGLDVGRPHPTRGSS